jgi:3-oxoacyl-(acyl-carrier-protein) synthase
MRYSTQSLFAFRDHASQRGRPGRQLVLFINGSRDGVGAAAVEPVTAGRTACIRRA